MKFKQQELKNILSIVCPLANKNNLLPILNNLFIKSNNNIIEFISSDGDNVIKYTHPSECENGEYLINSKIFQDYINLISSEDIELIFDDVCKIKSKTHKTNINLQKEQYINIPEIKIANEYIINIKELSIAISQVLFASATSDIKIELSGINLNFGEKLILASCDTARLAEKIINISGKNLDILIPSKSLSTLLNILSKINQGDIKIIADDNSIIFKTENIIFYSNLINGQFPNYQPLIPKEFKTEININKEQLINAIKTNALFSLDGAISLTISDKLYINTESTKGKNNSEIEILKIGEDNNVKYNYSYLLEIIENIKSEQIKIKINDSKSPTLIQANFNDNFICILMPLNF